MDFRRILSDAGVSSIRVVLGIVTSLITIPIITRWIGEDAYGIWVTVISAVGLVAMVSGMHLHGALIRYSDDGGDGEDGDGSQTFSDILTLSLLAALGAVALTLAGLFGYESTLGFESIPTSLLLPTAALVGAKIISSLAFNYPRAQQRVKRYEALVATRTLLETVVLVAAFWWARELAPALWGLVALTTAIDATLLIAYRANITRPIPGNFRKYLRYGVPMIPKEISGSLLHHADKFLIIYILGPTAAGIYAVAYSVTRIFPSVAGVFNSTLYPNVTAAWEKEEFGELEQFYSTFLRWYAILALPAIVGLMVLADPVLRFISTPTVAAQGAILIPVLAVAFSFQGLEFALSYPLAAAEETTKIALITTVAVILNLFLNIALIPTVGIIGAAAATLLAYGLRIGWLYYYTNSYLNLSLPLRGVGHAAVATAVMAGILLALPIDSWLWKLGLYPPIGALCFGLVFVLSGGVRAEEWELIVDTFGIEPEPVAYVVHSDPEWATEEWSDYVLCANCIWELGTTDDISPIYRSGDLEGVSCAHCAIPIDNVDPDAEENVHY